MKKKLLALTILFMLFGGSAGAFAYWDSLQDTDTGNTVTLGNGVAVTVTESTTGAGTLVPSGVILKTGDVTTVTFVYDVVLNETLGSDLTLAVAESNVAINGDATLGSAYANVTITNPGTVNGGTATQVTVEVTLTEPTEADYPNVANQDITFDLTFTAS